MPPTKGKMLAYSEEQMNNALDDVRRGVPVGTAAKRHCVPRVTLLYKSKGKSPIYRRMGPESCLRKDEEGILVSWIIRVAKAGFPVTKDELFDSVQQLVQELKRKNKIINDRPGRSWYESFLKRNPNISMRVAQNLTSESVTKKDLHKWSGEVYSYIEEHSYENILTDPSRVFNGDESAFFLNPKGNKVLAQRGDKTIYQQVNSDEKECLTVLVTGSASGKLAPPVVVFKYERIPQDIASSVPKQWGIGKSESDWMTGQLFYEFITNVFHPWLVRENITFPIILFIDGHVSHLTLHTSKFCENNGIILVALFPNATHLIQPMDVAVFRTLKETWKAKVHSWRRKNLDNPVLKKRHFSSLLEEVLQEKITSKVLQNGFRKCGLVPWNPDAVDVVVKASATSTLLPQRSQAMNAKINELQNGLTFIEKYVDKEKLLLFKANKDDRSYNWGEDSSLFHLWLRTSSSLVDARAGTLEQNMSTEGTAQKDNEEGSTTANDLDSNETDTLSEPLNFDCHVEDNVADEESRVSHENMDASTPLKQIVHSLDNMQASTSTSTLNKDSFIPTPFKRVLFWPEEKPNKKRVKIKTPSVVTSKLWQSYHEKKLERKDYKRKKRPKGLKLGGLRKKKKRMLKE